MAMDNFLEEVATKRNRGAETVMYVLANIMMVVFGLWAFLMLQGIMMLINAGEGAGPIIYYVVMTLLTGGIAVLLFLRRDIVEQVELYRHSGFLRNIILAHDLVRCDGDPANGQLGVDLPVINPENRIHDAARRGRLAR